MSQQWSGFIKTPRCHTCRMYRRIAVACATVLTITCTSGCGLFELGHPNLKSADPSLKIPAIKEAAAQHNTAAVPILIKGLNSTDPAIRFYSAYALKQITGQTLGYKYYAPEYQRQLAILRWHSWLSHHITAKPLAGGKS